MCTHITTGVFVAVVVATDMLKSKPLFTFDCVGNEQKFHKYVIFRQR